MSHSFRGSVSRIDRLEQLLPRHSDLSLSCSLGLHPSLHKFSHTFDHTVHRNPEQAMTDSSQWKNITVSKHDIGNSLLRSPVTLGLDAKQHCFVTPQSSHGHISSIKFWGHSIDHDLNQPKMRLALFVDLSHHSGNLSGLISQQVPNPQFFCISSSNSLFTQLSSALRALNMLQPGLSGRLLCSTPLSSLSTSKNFSMPSSVAADIWSDESAADPLDMATTQQPT